MRSLRVALVICCSCTLVQGQELIPNPSFEQASGCPVGPGELSVADLWIAPTLGTPDYFNPCVSTPDSVSTPDNAVGFQYADHGKSYAGFIALSPPLGAANYREYLQTSLVGAGLETGKTYRFSMLLSLAEDSSAATDRIGAYFSPTPVSSGDNLALPFTPQVETPAGAFLADTVDWMSFTETFVAVGGEQHVTIGNFHDAANSASTPAGSGPDPPLQDGTAYYYIDLVSLQCEPCTEPPADLVAWWPLDEADVGTAHDIVGAQHGLHVDAPFPLPGFVDHSLDFLGSAVKVPSTAELGLGTGDFSIDAWVRPGALGPTQALFVKLASVDPLTGPGYALALKSDGTLAFRMVDAALGTATGESTTAIDPGVWSHVTVTVDRDDPAGGKIHVNGTVASFDPTTATGSLSNTLPLWFARDGGAGVGSDFFGGLDEVEVFHRALTEAEVLALFQARTSGKCKVLLEVVPVIAVNVTPGTIGTTGVLTNSTDTTATFTVTLRGEPVGTRCGIRRSNVAGPSNPIVLSPQPIRVAPGESVPVYFQVDIPQKLVSGDLACYSVTTTHLETGRTFLSRGAVRGRPRERSRVIPGPGPPR